MKASQKPSKHFLISAAPLFLVLFIDSMGLGLVFPVLNTLIFDPSAHFFATELPHHTLNLLYGVTIGTYMLCWFFGAAFLGDLSDQIGRKKCLLICLLGAVLGYGLTAMAVIFSNYSLLMIGRIIAGFTAGSQSIAQAAIVDLSEPEHTARNLGFILFFCSLGFAFGPIIAGILSASSLVSWFNYAMPFYFAAGISFLNALLLLYFFQESFTHVHKIRFKLHHAINIFLSAFKNEHIRELSIVLLMMIFGWSGFYSFISMYLYQTYHFSSLQNGFYMGLLGVGFGIGTGFLIDPLTKRFSLRTCTVFGCIVTAAAIILTVTAPKEIHIWFDVILVAVAMAVAYSTILTLFSNQVDADSQGWVMGVTGAIMALAFGVNGVILGVLSNFSLQMPLLISAACMLVSAGLMQVLYKTK
ncbi:MAG: MFS transporter [Gammaproteobacteria bacterium]|nr:MFS transporter [Gammaproteobacteria bacterium]